MPDEEERTTPEENIFNRLADALTFHPASVSLFTPDWTLEPGDVVKVLSGEEEYDVPIFTMDLAWNGAVKTDVQSTGNQERQPLSALKRIEYQTARRGYGATRKLEEDVEETVQQYQHFTEENEVYRRSVYKIMGVTYDEHGNVIYQRDPVTGELILDEAGNPIPVYDENSNGSITGQVLQTAQNYTSLYQMTLNAPEFDPTTTYHIGDMVMHGGVVYKFTAEHTGDWTGLDVAVVPPLQSQITQNAQEISQKVSSGDLAGYLTITAMQTAFGNTAVANDGTITKAEFSTSVVDGIATAGITADKILITGDTGIAGALTVAGYLFANDLFVENGAYVQDTIHVGGVHVYEDASFDGDITMTSTGTIETGVIETEANITCGGDLSVTGDLTVTGTFSFDNISVDNVTATEYVTAAAFQIDDGGEPRTISELPVTIGGDTVSDLSILATGEAESLAIPDAITDIEIVAPSSGSNVYTINKKTFHNTSWTEVGTFSRATTLTGGWGSSDTDAGMFSVDADPQEQHYKIKFNGTGGTANAVFDVELGTITASNLGNSYGTVPIYIGTYTESGTMAHQVELNRTTLISSELRNAWTQSGFDTGYAAGQANAAAAIYNGEITYARNDTQYAASKLFVDVSAFPALLLTDTAEPPNTTTTVGSKVTDTIEIPVTVTAATLTSTYANGTYTVTKSSGGKVSVDGADIDVGVTSYPISAATAIADGRNSVEVGTALLDDPTFVTDTTQAHDRKYTISGTVQLDYQSGVDGSGNPVYTNIGNPVTIQAKNITSVYNTGWTDGSASMGVTGSWGTGSNANVFTYSATESSTKQETLTVSKGNVSVTAQWDSENAVYNLSGTGSFTVGSKSFTQTPYSDTLTPTNAIAAGWTAACNGMLVPTQEQTANGYISVSVPPKNNVGGASETYRYTLSADDDHVYLKRTDVTPNVVVAQMDHSGGAAGTITDITAQELSASTPFVSQVVLTASGTNLLDYTENVYLGPATISGGVYDGYHCVEMTLDSKVVGRISVEQVYTAGQNSVHIVGPVWDSVSATYPHIATATISKDAGTPDDVNLSLYLTDDQSWDSSKKKVYIRPGSGSATPVAELEIDASEVYVAGQQSAQSGNVDVVKGNWITEGKGYKCEFSPASGTGAHQYVKVEASPYIPIAQSSTLSNVAEIDLKDTIGRTSLFGGISLYLKQYNSYAYICSNNNQPNLSTNVLARITLQGSVFETPRSVDTLGKVTLGENDIGMSVSKSTLVTYDDIPPDEEYKTIEIDASAVYAKGRTDGASSGSQSIQTYRYTSNNTYRILPTAPYGTMVGADIEVAVPRRNAEGLSQKIVLGSSDIGTNITKSVTVGYDEGPDSIMGVSIDASAVYQAGVAEGTGGTYEMVTLTLQNPTPTKFKGQYMYPEGDTFYARGNSVGAAYVPDTNGDYALRGAYVERTYLGTLYDFDDNDRPVSRGSGCWFLIPNVTNVAKVYRGNGTALRYDASLYYGDGGAKKAIGDNYQYCYVIDSNGTVLYYPAGQTVTDRYYIKK